jgi:NDP-sugar pyrophosphorylase family protein
MEPYTSEMPKALIPVNGQPFIAHQLAYLQHQGISDVVLSIGYRGEQLQKYVADGAAWKLRVRYVDEGKTPRGTGGAVRLAIEQQTLEPSFLMLYGDSYLPIDFSEVWRYFQKSGAHYLMTVYKNDNQRGPSNVLFENGRIRLYDKRQTRPEMHHMDYGLLAFQRDSLLRKLPAGTSDLATTLTELSQRGELAGYEVKNRFYEAGSTAGLAELASYLKNEGAA